MPGARNWLLTCACGAYRSGVITGMLLSLSLPAAEAGQYEVPDVKMTTIKATMSFEQIKHGLASRFSRFQNLTMHCELRETVVNGRKPGQIKNGTRVQQLIGDKKLAFPWMKAETRYDGDRSYVRLAHPSYVNQADAPETAEECWNGTRGMRFEHIPRTGVIVGRKTNGVRRNLLLEHLYWPCVEADLNEEGHLYLPSTIDTAGVRVRKHCEIVLGSQCHVVEIPGLDELWIDTERGYAVVMRRRRFDRNGPLKAAAVHRDWQEVSPGVWLPKSSTIHYFCGPKRPVELHNTVSTSVTIKSTFEQKPLSVADFTLDFPANALVHDTTRNKFIRVGSTLEKNIESDEFEDVTISSANTPLTAKPWAFRIIMINVIVLLAAALAWGWWHLRGR